MSHAKNDSANAAHFIRNVGRCRRTNLNGVEEPSVANRIDICGQFLVDCQENKGLLDLAGTIRSHAIETGRGGIPVPPEVAVHELSLIGQSAKCITKDSWPLARLDNAEINLLIVEAPILIH